MDDNQKLNLKIEALRRASDLHLQNNARLADGKAPATDAEIVSTAEALYEFLSA